MPCLPQRAAHSSSTACRRAPSTCCKASLAPACCSAFSSVKRWGHCRSPSARACAVVRTSFIRLLRTVRSFFGFRRGAFAIPKKAGTSFFGIVESVLLWITFGGVEALAGDAFGQDLQPRRQRAAGQQRVFRDLLERVQAYRLDGLGRMAEG